jgi:spermidine synthase
MAFGYSLLSVCLFRMLSFTLSSTAFFVLYVAAAMPFGAYLAQRRMERRTGGLRFPLAALVALALMLPLVGWLATRGQAMTSASNPFVDPRVDLRLFWRQLVYQLLAVSPVFITWGFAEFVGYQAAIRSGSRGLQRGFYLIFVWALACAFAVGYWTIPRWGLLPTLALAPLAAVVGYDFSTGFGTSRFKRLVRYGVVVLVAIAAAPLEDRFVRLLLVDVRYNVGDVLDNRRLPWRNETGDTSVLEMAWGKYTHFSLVQYKGARETQVLGAYDGVVYWEVSPARKNNYTPLTAAVVDFLPEQADVAILGAGGGRQVSDALNRNPHSVVAVDLVPEIFTLLKGKYAWVNGHVYQSPLVETVAADGRSYLAATERRFDAILLPHTESALANIRSLFEVGSRLHSVEAFRLMRSRLKPAGIVATMKAVDVNGRLFTSYAAGLREAGFHVVGWTMPTSGLQSFLLMASPSREALARGALTQDFFARSGYKYVDFDETVPTAPLLFDDSPWVLGVLGTMVAPEQLRQMLSGVAWIAVVAVLGVTGLSLRRRESGETVSSRLAFVLAGMSVGAHAAYVQNAVIFWLLVNLFNPLAAFFLGTAVFLLAWGLSSTLMNKRYLLRCVGAAGIAGMLLSDSWHGYGSLVSLACIAIGSGLYFPLLGLTFQSRLLNLFVADAIGGYAAGVLGILLPVLAGFNRFFDVLPWISLGTMILVTLALRGQESRTTWEPAFARPRS